jgi:hypothetical protein
MVVLCLYSAHVHTPIKTFSRDLLGATHIELWIWHLDFHFSNANFVSAQLDFSVSKGIAVITCHTLKHYLFRNQPSNWFIGYKWSVELKILEGFYFYRTIVTFKCGLWTENDTSNEYTTEICNYNLQSSIELMSPTVKRFRSTLSKSFKTRMSTWARWQYEVKC